MKKVFSFLAAVLLTASVFAQSPEIVSYQAVIRNSSQALVTNTKVGMKISILQGSESGTAVYAETQTPTTNVNGLVSIEIGTGTVVNGSFSTINWAKGPYFIKTETDPTGGTNYTIIGTSRLLSVPYSLHAKTAESISGGIKETDPLWSVSPSFGITNTDITNWNSAYSWGGHSGLYRPISWVPSWTDVTDKPTFATGITNTDITNWNSAYSWGGHASLYLPIAWVPSWTDITGKPTFAKVATSGDYNDLSNKPIIGGGIKETDPLWSVSPSFRITNTDITNWNSAYSCGGHAGLYRPIAWVPSWTDVTGKPTFATVATSGNYNDLTNKPMIDGSETKVTAGTNVTVTGDGTTINPYVINSTAGPHYLGEEYLGGIIFNLYTTSDGTQHGLIVSKTETIAIWGNTSLVGADRTGDGSYNMSLMPTGAGTARTWVETTLGADWYLPSVDELSLLWHSRYYVNKTARAVRSTLLSKDNIYWSSTEDSATDAFNFEFNNGSSGGWFFTKTFSYSVRAVRAF